MGRSDPLAHPTQPMHSLGLDNRGSLPRLEHGSQLIQEILAAGEH